MENGRMCLWNSITSPVHILHSVASSEWCAANLKEPVSFFLIHLQLPHLQSLPGQNRDSDRAHIYWLPFYVAEKRLCDTNKCQIDQINHEEVFRIKWLSINDFIGPTGKSTSKPISSLSTGTMWRFDAFMFQIVYLITRGSAAAALPGPWWENNVCFHIHKYNCITYSPPQPLLKHYRRYKTNYKFNIKRLNTVYIIMNGISFLVLSNKLSKNPTWRHFTHLLEACCTNWIYITEKPYGGIRLLCTFHPGLDPQPQLTSSHHTSN